MTSATLSSASATPRTTGKSNHPSSTTTTPLSSLMMSSSSLLKKSSSTSTATSTSLLKRLSFKRSNGSHNSVSGIKDTITAPSCSSVEEEQPEQQQQEQQEEENNENANTFNNLPKKSTTSTTTITTTVNNNNEKVVIRCSNLTTNRNATMSRNSSTNNKTRSRAEGDDGDGDGDEGDHGFELSLTRTDAEDENNNSILMNTSLNTNPSQQQHWKENEHHEDDVAMVTESSSSTTPLMGIIGTSSNITMTTMATTCPSSTTNTTMSMTSPRSATAPPTSLRYTLNSSSARRSPTAASSAEHISSSSSVASMPSLRHRGLAGPTTSAMASKSKLAAVLSKSRNNSKNLALKADTISLSSAITYKIFILLLHPKSKIFELIQLIYLPEEATVGDILEMIPSNATEPALGMQKYTGLCRPIEEENIHDLELYASQNDNNDGKPTADITRGEILVAIPFGFTGKDVAVLSRQILQNPKICKLLQRSDPLALKYKNKNNNNIRMLCNLSTPSNLRSRKNEFRRSNHMSELDDDSGTEHSASRRSTRSMPEKRSPSKNVDDTYRQAMEKAAEAAAQANAEVITPKKHKHHNRPPQVDPLFGDKNNIHRARRNGGSSEKAKPTGVVWEKLDADHSPNNDMSSTSTGSYSGKYPSSRIIRWSENKDIMNDNSINERTLSCDDSLDVSYASWSKSLDTSLASQVSSRHKRQQRKKQNQVISSGSVAVFTYMVLYYFIDPNGYLHHRHHKANNTIAGLYYYADEYQQPFGLRGLIQFTCIFIVMIKFQIFFNIKNNTGGGCRSPMYNIRHEYSYTNNNDNTNCPFLKSFSKVTKQIKDRLYGGGKRRQQQQHYKY